MLEIHQRKKKEFHVRSNTRQQNENATSYTFSPLLFRSQFDKGIERNIIEMKMENCNTSAPNHHFNKIMELWI